MHVTHTKGLDANFNFETFGRSMIILFQISTSAGWDSVLAGLMNEEECNPNATETRPNGDCGSSGLGILYLVTYLVISFLVVINMYIAVILENFSQATEDVQQGLTQDDFDMFYEVWERYDEEATEYIPLSRLSEFVEDLEEPLRLPLPNYFRLVFLNIPICEGEKVHCVDILDALTKNFLGTAEEGGDLPPNKGPERHEYHPVTTTLKRQREIVCAKTVQKAWREYVGRRKGLSPDAARAAAIEATSAAAAQYHDSEAAEAGADAQPADGSTEGADPAAAPTSSTPIPRTIVNIEEVDEEEDATDKSKSADPSMQEDSKQGASPAKDTDDAPSTDPTGDPDDTQDDSRTVELHPDSEVVA